MKKSECILLCSRIYCLVYKIIYVAFNGRMGYYEKYNYTA